VLILRTFDVLSFWGNIKHDGSVLARAPVYNIVIYISVVFVAHVIDLQRSRVRR